MHARDGGVDRRGRRRARPREDRHSGRRRFQDAAGRAQHPPRRHASSSRKRGCTTTSATRCSPSSAPTSSTASSPPAGRNPKIGIITAGKSYLDVRQALDELGIDEVRATTSASGSSRSAARGRSRARELKDSPKGLELIIVVEEKRSLIEVQVREELYGTAEPADRASARRTSRATGCSRSRARSIRTTSRSRSASASCARGHNERDREPRVAR